MPCIPPSLFSFQRKWKIRLSFLSLVWLGLRDICWWSDKGIYSSMKSVHVLSLTCGNFFTLTSLPVARRSTVKYMKLHVVLSQRNSGFSLNTTISRGQNNTGKEVPPSSSVFPYQLNSAKDLPDIDLAAQLERAVDPNVYILIRLFSGHAIRELIIRLWGVCSFYSNI